MTVWTAESRALLEELSDLELAQVISRAMGTLNLPLLAEACDVLAKRKAGGS